MSPPLTSAQARRRTRRPLRWSPAGLRWLMAGVLVASSWGAGSVMPVRAMTGILGVGTSGPVTPTEENESHSSTPLVMEAGGGMRRRVCATETPSRRAPHRQGESSLAGTRYASIPRNCSEGHRLANGLMAPMLT